MANRQNEAPPPYDYAVNPNTPQPLYPGVQATQSQPYYIPQQIPHTPAPYVIQTVPSQAGRVQSSKNKKCCYGGSGGTAILVTLVVIAVGVGIRYGPSLWAFAGHKQEPDTCPASAVNCDGKKDCSKGSDESVCVRFGTGNELQVMTSKTGSFLPVCDDGWSTSIADQTCKQLGFKQSYQKNVLPTSASSFQSVTNGQFSNNIQGSVQASTSCPSQKTVSLQCSDCGKPPTNTKIIGGTPATEGQWPWQASLHFKRSHTCGGSLVAPDIIVTAAHCFPKESSDSLVLSNWRVYIGMVSQLKLPSPYYVKQIIINEKYNSDTKDYDIALLKLETPVSNIQPVCLPVTGQTFPSGTQCWTTGFGVTQEGSASSSTYLMEVAVSLIDSTTCNAKGVYSGLITANMQCAGYLSGGKDSCQGDSGGPLVCKAGDGRWFLTGITSWGEGCGRRSRPGIYSNVERLLPWTLSKMQQVQG